MLHALLQFADFRRFSFSLLGFFMCASSYAVAVKTADDYPQLHEEKSSSAHYEITKLIDGPIDALYRINRTGEFLAQTHSRLWKINPQGQVIDYFDPDHFYASGLILEKEGFIDWVFTGDKQLKPFAASVDAKTYSEQQLFALFDQAQALEFEDNDGESGLAYWYKDGALARIDISHVKDKIDDFYYRQTVSKDYNLRREETDVHASRFTGYTLKNPPLAFLVEPEHTPESLLKLTGFKKTHNHYPYSRLDTFFENTLGVFLLGGSRRDYSHPVGYSQYQLQRNHEKLNFSVFSGETYDPKSAWNFSFLGAPPKAASDINFLSINYRRHYLVELNEKSLLPYYEQDVGLYVARPKIPHNQASAPAWQLSYSGLHSYQPIWGHIQFAQPTLSPVYYWFRQDRPIAAEAQADMSHFGRRTNIASPLLKTLPSALSFHWTDFKRDHRVRLVVNGKDASFYLPDDTEVNIVLQFDAAELQAAIAQLRQAPAASLPAAFLLNLDLQARDYGAELILSVQAKDKKIILQKVSFKKEAEL